MFEFYPNPGNSSAIDGYLIYPDKIYVRYGGNRVYGYSYASAGASVIEEMKRLAQDGEGLCRYIRSNAAKNYFFKGVEADIQEERPCRTTEVVGIAPMSEALRQFDFRPYLKDMELPYYSVRVVYKDSVEECDMVPGLTDIVRKEYEQILRHMRRFFRLDGLRFEGLTIELSDLHKVSRYAGLSDHEIIMAIEKLYKSNGNPTPEEVKQILSQKDSVSDVLGTYSGDHISLFYRIMDTNHGEDGYIAQLRNTLAHEMLHACHDRIAPETFHDPSVQALRVEEALADFYGFLYTLHPEYNVWGEAVLEESTRVSMVRYMAWVNKFGTSWPYAYALCFIPEDQRTDVSTDVNDYECCLAKYRKVMDISRSSMQDAYEELMQN